MGQQIRAAFAAATRERSLDLTVVCALIAAELAPAGVVDVDDISATVRSLAERVPTAGTPAQRLRTVLGGFHGDQDDYSDLRSSLLPDVLNRRRGLPILLSVVWLETARLAGIEAYGASLPGHFVVGLGSPEGAHEVVDPWRGGPVVAEPPGEVLDAWDPVDIVARVLANIRHWAAASPDRIHTRLAAVELALLLPRHSLALRRERGELLVRSGDFAGGASELEDYAEIVQDQAPRVADDARNAARMARARLN